MTSSRSSRPSLRSLGLAVALVLAAGVARGQTTWTKHPGNPVLPLGAPGEWDAGNAGLPVVLFDGVSYRMWYAGGRGTAWEDIGYATSSDGVTWAKHPGNPVLRRDPGMWDGWQIWPAAAVFDGVTYHVWYCGYGYPFQAVERTGYATSPDGVMWTKHPANPILPAGPAGSWDDAGPVLGGVLLEGGTFRGWYSGARVVGQGFGTLSVGYATSSDGVNWAKWPEPVLEPTEGGWDANLVPGPVVFDGSAYHMWYTDFGRLVQIGHAVSPDGIRWTKHPTTEPVLRPGGAGAFDTGGVVFPAVILAGDKAQMWYAGSATSYSAPRLGYATAPLPFPDPPVAAFTSSPTSPIVGQPVAFTDESSNAPTSWAWSFGDGTTSTEQNPTHAFAAAGVYTVALTAANALGPSIAVARAVTVAAAELHVVRKRVRRAGG